ncbi:PKD domain-containing protein, partial [Bacteroidetes/Chlorobi group bacterium ChocPot_Mid]
QGTPTPSFNGLTYLELEVSSTDPTDDVVPWIWKIPIYITDNNLLPNLTKEFGAAYNINVFKNQSILTSMKAVDQDKTLGKLDSTFYDFYLWDTNKNQYHDIPSATFTIQGDSALFNWVPTINDVGNYKLVGQAWDYYMKMDTCKSDVSVYYMKPDFSSTCPVGFAPLSVTFTDKSVAENTTITQYKWSFDDGSFSTDRNPVHAFTNSGTYTVSLEIYNGINRVEERKFFYVVVNSIDFKADTTSGFVPFEVPFRNLSTTELPLSITSNTATSVEFSWLWEMGDGKTVREKEPLYTYNDPGIFTVSLTGIIYYTYPINDSTTKTDTVVSAKKMKTDYITAIGDLMANFEADVTDGYAPLKVKFTDKSTGQPTAWLWTFGDGSPDGTTQNPVHTYTTPGVYNVSLTVYRGELQNKKQNSQMINVRQPVTAAFTASPTTGTAPLLVTFTNQSLGDPPITAWYWDFGDGATSVEKDPTHLYRNSGSYNVTLIVDNTDKRDTLTKNNYIVITAAELNADFSAEPLSGEAPLTVKFTDLSTGNPTDWRWYFGFNDATSSDRDPVYTYQNSGTYTVTLIVSKGTEIDTTIKENYIIVGGTGIKEMMENSFELFQNYPNPLRHSTTINFTLNYSSQVTLRVFNVLGEEVKTFFNGQKHDAGHYFVSWDGRDNTGRLLPAGVYYYELTLEGSQYRVGKTREMIIVK